MANANVQGLFDELGLGTSNDQEILKQAQKRRAEHGMGVGELHPGISALAGGIGSFFGKNKDKSFFEGAAAGAQKNQDRTIASATGEDIEVVGQRRNMRRKLSQIQVEDTGDGMTDQLAALDEIIRIANQQVPPDFQLITRANAKRMALKRQAADLKSLESQTEARESKTTQDTAVHRKDFATGVDIIPEGANPRDKDFLPVSATFDPTPTPEFPKGHWTRADTGEQLESVQVFNPDALGLSGGLRNKVSQTPLALARSQSGTGKAFAAKKTQLTDMAKTSQIAADVSDLFLSFRDPQALTAWFGKTAITAGKAIRFGESTARLIRGETGDTKYIDESSQKEFKNDQIHFNGELMSGEKQRKQALSAANSLIEKAGGIDKFIPEHLRAQLGEIERGAAQFQAMVMEMAFMDARLQEPSNRGLSDKDIEAALSRIGAFAADPTVFINRQLQKARINLNHMETLGEEYSDVLDSDGRVMVDKELLTRATYNDVHVDRVKRDIAADIAKLEQAKRDILSGNTGPDAVPISDETKALSPEELQRQIDALEGR